MSDVIKHIKAIFKDQELDEKATVNQQLTVQKDGHREVERTLTPYNKTISSLEQQAKKESRKKGGQA
ncbi:MAG TPA: hypothetical protein HPP91_09285 [Gammaproteobacteria bacterium]|jgi:hypothetical protein|nr:hypothetical protein [Gammaproteobacteria bacterium]HIJ48649.1 hypothetical protein [Gammaproteobacteria bacterium]